MDHLYVSRLNEIVLPLVKFYSCLPTCFLSSPISTVSGYLHVSFTLLASLLRLMTLFFFFLIECEALLILGVKPLKERDPAICHICKLTLMEATPFLVKNICRNNNS